MIGKAILLACALIQLKQVFNKFITLARENRLLYFSKRTNILPHLSNSTDSSFKYGGWC